MKKYCNKWGVRVVNPWVINISRCEDMVGCKVETPESQKDILLDPTFWPENVTCRAWSRDKPAVRKYDRADGKKDTHVKRGTSRGGRFKKRYQAADGTQNTKNLKNRWYRNSEWKGETSNEYWWNRGEEVYSDEDWVDRVEREEWTDRAHSDERHNGVWGWSADRDCDPEYRY